MKTEFGDITRYFAQQDISFDGKELQGATLSFLLRNPVYRKRLLTNSGFGGTRKAKNTWLPGKSSADGAGLALCAETIRPTHPISVVGNVLTEKARRFNILR